VLKYLTNFSILAALILSSPSAFGWSGYVHRIIAEIANQQISTSTRNQIETITQENLEKSANWADAVKNSSVWRHTKNYHYKNIDGEDYFADIKTLSATQLKKGDMIRALVSAEDILRSKSSSLADKKTALRFLIHLIGDIHQPLHAGYRSDGGGNSLGVTWYTKKTNFHALWDGSLTGSFAYQNQLPSPMTSNDYIKELRKPSSSEIKKWQNSYILDWFNETLDGRALAYNANPNSNDAYYQHTIGLVNDRVLMAGFRLAGWLEEIYSGKPLKASAVQLRKNLAATVGEAAEVQIDLEPRDSRSVFIDDDASPCDHH